MPTPVFLGFPGSSDGKESSCNVGDLGSIPGLGRFPAERLSYTFQYSWASLVAQMVKNPPAIQGAWVRSLDWEDALEKGFQYSCLENPMDRGTWWATVHGVRKSCT